MAMGTFSSRILGFLRDAIMYALFPRSVTDAWVVAWRLPNIFRRVLGEGSLAPSFVPIYVESRVHSEEKARQLSNAVFSIVFAVSTVISIACFVFMEPIMEQLVAPDKVAHTVYLSRIMIFYLILVSTFAFHMAIANTHGHFFIPSIGPTLFNAGLILFTVTKWEVGSYAASTQSWGVIFGGVLQVGVVAWLLIREGCLPRFTWRWNVEGVRHVFTNMVPGLFSLGVFQVMTLVNTMFASRLDEGAQSYIYAADRVLELPQSLIAVSLGTVLLPRFSELSARGSRAEFLSEANRAVRTLLYLSLPAAVGMYVLAQGLTEVLFMRGHYTLADATQTASVVEIYAVLMLFSSLSRVTAPAFYAIKNTWLPAVVAAGVLINHLIIGPILVDRLQLRGLALATSASSILNIVVLQICFHFWIGPLGYPRILASVARLTPALVALGVFCHYAYAPLVGWLEPWLAAGAGTGSGGSAGGAVADLTVRWGLGRVAALFLVIGVGMILFFAVSVISGCEEAQQVKGLVRRRFGKKKPA